MICDVCREILEADRKYVVYLLGSIQARICTKCIMRGVRAGSGAIVTKNDCVMQPFLAFYTAHEKAREIAEEAGWLVAPIEESGTEVEVITEHWDRAQNQYWFANNGTWVRDVRVPVNECFKRSCENIRDNYGLWLIREKKA